MKAFVGDRIDAHMDLAGKGPAEPQRDVLSQHHVKTWRVEVNVFEEGDDTTAHAVLVADVPAIDARGRATRNPHDTGVPEIGDEVAVARALRQLSDRLLGVAAEDIAAVEARLVEF